MDHDICLAASEAPFLASIPVSKAQEKDDNKEVGGGRKTDDPMIWKLTREGGKDKEMFKKYAQVFFPTGKT